MENTHQTTRRHILYDSILHFHECENLMSHASIVWVSARDATMVKVMHTHTCTHAHSLWNFLPNSYNKFVFYIWTTDEFQIPKL